MQTVWLQLGVSFSFIYPIEWSLNIHTKIQLRDSAVSIRPSSTPERGRGGLQTPWTS